jgi:peptidoglycan/xylan/chitin deacetylase (PgdA/CDA1 family)
MHDFKRYTITIILLLYLAGAKAQIPYTVVAYHDIVNKKTELVGDAITAEELVNHFEWLAKNGYTPVSLRAIIDAEKGLKPLPPKAVLLSFDDGYVSVYTKVFPLLQLYKYPAIVALVGSYLVSEVDSIAYGNAKKARTDFLNWEQIKRMKTSGLVEFASHTYDLHKEVRSNKQGNTNPAAVTFMYDTSIGQIETEAAYIKRIDADFKANNSLFIKELGELPKAIVWPYGRYNSIVRDIATQNELPVSINLNTYANYGTELHFNINRFYITRNATADALRNYLENNQRMYYQRSLQVPVNSFRDAPNDEAEPQFNDFLNTIAATTANTVIIPVLYQEGDSLFTLFKNQFFPWKNTQLNRVVWQSQSRIQTDVYLLWDEQLLQQSGLKYTQLQSFFASMGRVAPARGVLIKSDSVMQYFKSIIANSFLHEKNNSQLVKNRNKLLATNYLQLPTMLRYLQSFQQYQEDLSTLLYVSDKELLLIKDTLFMNQIAAHFNSILIDMSTSSTKTLIRFLKQIPLYVPALSRITIQLPILSAADFNKVAPWLIKKHIFNYGFKIETLDDLKTKQIPVHTRKVYQE